MLLTYIISVRMAPRQGGATIILHQLLLFVNGVFFNARSKFCVAIRYKYLGLEAAFRL